MIQMESVYMKIAHFQTDGSTSKCSELYHPKPSSPCKVSLGIRLLNRATLPLARAIESCWKRWQMVVVSSSPVWRARALPSFLTLLMAILCQAPRLSTAR